jgi:hypothetical protein
METLMTIKKAPAVNYLNNKDILREIHKSKLSYCYVADTEYAHYDIILTNVSEISPDTIKKAKENRAYRMKNEKYAEAIANHSTAIKNKPKQKEFLVDPENFADHDVVFRIMDFSHIPEEEGRKKNPKTEADEKSKVNFPPFKHYVLLDQQPVEVVRSHWRGDLETGEFCADHGRLTNKLGTMFLKLVERYSHRSNWRGYTYVDEMRGQALVQLAYIGLQFNEAKSDNPFAYYTAVVNNSFTRILNIEKRNQTIRDDILIDSGHLPSYTRQLAHEEENRLSRELADFDKMVVEDFENL